MIEVKEISKSYRGNPALKPVTLTISSGQTTVLIGPSGCGKSSLLRILIGLIKPDTGTVTIGGTLITEQNAMTLRRRVGYVIQDGGLFPHLTAYDNAALMARFLGWNEQRVATRIAELSQLTQFPDNCHRRFPPQISGGQRQRVSLIRALMLDPDFLLLDEPMGALDPIIRSELQEVLRRIFETLKKTVVLVTHDIGEADYLGEQIVLMRAGEIVQVGRMETLAREPKDPFVSKFIAAQRVPPCVLPILQADHRGIPL
jgi:osmoprotectant transport system ATP-binding protein